MKWKASDYRRPFQHWSPPKRMYPSDESELMALHALKNAFGPLSPYKQMEAEAIEQNALVSIDIPLPDGYIAFLENTAEKCTSPQSKHSQAGMQGAKHWVQRVAPPAEVYQRLTDGYGISLMFGERCHQYIRNKNNWRGIFGCMLDIDIFWEHPEIVKAKTIKDGKEHLLEKRLAENEKLPKPCYRQDELFDRYPLLPQICSFLIPSASSLYDGRPFKARGIILFTEPITDQRTYRAFGDLLLSELDCIPANVTKNPVAVGFGNTHNAHDAVFNDAPDTAWITEALEQAQSTVRWTAKKRNREQKKKAKRTEHHRVKGTAEGENISAFIDQCDPVAEMVKAGWLTPGRGNEYRWHEASSDRSCEIFGDGVLHIFSHSMSAASPAAELEPVNGHRFYLYQLTGLDLASMSDKAKCREYLFDRGYGSDPKAFAKNSARSQPIPEVLTPEQEKARVDRLIAQAPIGVNEPPSYRHFLPEDRQLIRACGYDPEASYTEHSTGRKPVWIPKYDKLYDATGQFQLNGQPKHVETYRVWNTLLQTCHDCQRPTKAFWIDRFHLTAGTYCDKCHKDETINSTLALELRRELPNAYTSVFDGFIGEDDFWKDMPLWKAGRTTHLGAAMAQGKTTLIQETGCEIATRDEKFFIICVPRISLALNIASKLNRQYGEGAFGIYYESSRYKQHGRIGAVCTLTSLPLIFQEEWNDLEPQDCLIFIDEIDFSYPLNELVTLQAKKVKRILRQSLHANGLVTAGQTEYSSVVQAFAEEMETDDVFGYYKNAKQHEGLLQWVEYPDIDGKEIMVAAGAAKSVQTGLDAADVVHVFTSERRQAEILGKMFEHENPLVYTSLTKHRERCKRLLDDRKLTDTRLFIATSAADVGISIEDPRDTRTIVASTLLYGRIPVETMVQETARVRGTPLIEIHVPRYETALPLKPTETKNVFQQSLTLKREIAAIEDDDFLRESRIATKKALVRTLRELAEQQPLTFFEHHLHDIAGYQIAPTEPAPVAKSQQDTVRVLKKESWAVEKEKRLEYAEQVITEETQRYAKLKGSEPYEYLPAALQSSTEIRQNAADGYLTSFNLLGQRYVNELAVAIGFDDLPDRVRSGDPQQPIPFQWNDADLPCIKAMVNAGIDASVLTLRIQGYIAALDTAWTQQHTESDLLQKEWTAVTDYRGIGRLARHLCEKLQGLAWRADAFASAIHDTLHAETPSGNLLSDIKSGAMGGAIYKKGRFLFKSDDFGGATSQHLQLYADFAISVLETYLPVKVATADTQGYRHR